MTSSLSSVQFLSLIVKYIQNRFHDHFCISLFLKISGKLFHMLAQVWCNGHFKQLVECFQLFRGDDHVCTLDNMISRVIQGLHLDFTLYVFNEALLLHCFINVKRPCTPGNIDMVTVINRINKITLERYDIQRYRIFKICYKHIY